MPRISYAYVTNSDEKKKRKNFCSHITHQKGFPLSPPAQNLIIYLLLTLQFHSLPECKKKNNKKQAFLKEPIWSFSLVLH